ALKKYQMDKPDIILMDIQMPVMNGIEATKRIRMLDIEPRTPILALTAGNMLGEKERCLEAGMDDFMPKPIVKKDLALKFNKWLGIVETKEQSVQNTVQHLN